MSESEPYIEMNPADLNVRPPFSDLLAIRKNELDAIVGSMADRGYDQATPIIVWRSQNVVVDGHTRRKAAMSLGIKVLVCYHEFANEDEALGYAIDAQSRRRNLPDADLFRLKRAHDKRKKRGPESGENWHGNQYASAEASRDASTETNGKSAAVTAKALNVSTSKVERMRCIEDYAKKTGDTTELDAVLAGTMTINKAVTTIRKKRNPPPARKTQEELAAERKAALKVDRPTTPVAAASLDARPLTDEEIAWVSSLPLWGRVPARKYQTDALIRRRLDRTLKEMGAMLREVAGVQTEIAWPTLYGAVHRLAGTPPPERWLLCTRCQGTGLSDVPECRKCKGGGYTIPNS